MKHHVRTKKLLLPIVAIVAVVGAVAVFVTHASSYVYCTQSNGNYTYDAGCVTNSDEASVIRMYYATLNRAPDKSGLTYWLGKIKSGSVTLTKMADQFMASSEFKNKYGTLSNAAFVNAMYPQVFGRAPDKAGAAYWTKKLDAKTITRPQLIVNFVQSSEMKNSFATRVALALNISPNSFTTNTTTVPSTSVTCLGTISTDTAGKKWCTVNLASTSMKTIAAASISLAGNTTVTKPGGYVYCTTIKAANLAPYSTNPSSPYVRYGSFVPTAGSVASGTATLHQQPLTGAQFSVLPDGFVFCASISLLPTAEQSLTAPVVSQGQPSNATYSFDMNSVTIGKVVGDTSVNYQESFDPTRTTQFLPSGDATVNSVPLIVKGKSVVTPIRYNFGVLASSDTPKPDWIHQTDYFQGKQAIHVSTAFGYGPTIGLKVTNAVTGAPITDYQVVAHGTDNSGKQILTNVNKTQFALPNTYSGFYVKLNPAQPTKVKLEVSVLDNNTYINNSYLSSMWPQ